MKILIFLSLSLSFLFATSIASYPKDWRSWVVVKEKVMQGNKLIPQNQSSLFRQEVTKSNDIHDNLLGDEVGMKISIYVPKHKLKEYRKQGPYSDGVTAVLFREKENVVFVTEHFNREPIYGAYDTQGNDVSDTLQSFNINNCAKCHTEYPDKCIFGICSK